MSHEVQSLKAGSNLIPSGSESLVDSGTFLILKRTLLSVMSVGEWVRAVLEAVYLYLLQQLVVSRILAECV